MRSRARILVPLTVAGVLLTACGQSGSSGTGGAEASGGTASGNACAPVAGDQLVVLRDDRQLQNADNVIPAVNAAAAQANPAILPALEAGSQIQVFPEYLATATEAINKQVNGPDATQVAGGDVQATLAAVTPLGFSEIGTVLALAAFAVPPMLTNTHVGFREVDRDVREAARAMGMSRRQLLTRVEFPLALPLVMTGVRTAAVQVVATATLAALVGGGGLGRIINLGFGQQDPRVILAGAVVVAALALLTELLLVLASMAVTPGPRRWPLRPVRAPRAGEPEPTSSGVPL